jgi:hypothetical protein
VARRHLRDPNACVCGGTRTRILIGMFALASSACVYLHYEFLVKCVARVVGARVLLSFAQHTSAQFNSNPARGLEKNTCKYCVFVFSQAENYGRFVSGFVLSTG